MKNIKVGEDFEVTVGPNKGGKILIHSIEVIKNELDGNFETFITVQPSFIPTLVTASFEDFLEWVS